ncbi:TonB-dependent receptor-like protein, partial [mine drainage metagenome]
YATDVDGIGYHAGLNTVYLLQYQNVPIAGAAPIDVLSTLENPVNFRGRVTAGADKDGWSLNGAVNYVNHYSDPTGLVPVSIASWTTVDLQMAYRVVSGHLPWNGLQVALSCTNCLNRAPPPVKTTSYLFGYDPTNSSPMGRFLSLTVRKRW